MENINNFNSQEISQFIELKDYKPKDKIDTQELFLGFHLFLLENFLFSIMIFIINNVTGISLNNKIIDLFIICFSLLLLFILNNNFYIYSFILIILISLLFTYYIFEEWIEKNILNYISFIWGENQKITKSIHGGLLKKFLNNYLGDKLYFKLIMIIYFILLLCCSYLFILFDLNYKSKWNLYNNICNNESFIEVIPSSYEEWKKLKFSDTHLIKINEIYDLFMNTKENTLLFTGEPGLGKTETAKYFAAQKGGGYLINISTLIKYDENGLDIFLDIVNQCIKEKKVLIIDDCDISLLSRNTELKGKNTSIVHGFTNLFLSIMNNKDLSIICTSNNLVEVDSAYSRRMNILHFIDSSKLLGKDLYLNSLKKSISARKLNNIQRIHESSNTTHYHLIQAINNKTKNIKLIIQNRLKDFKNNYNKENNLL